MELKSINEVKKELQDKYYATLKEEKQYLEKDFKNIEKFLKGEI